MKNKTAAAWLALVGGAIGAHRFYLHGPRDTLGWLLPLPTLAGLYGILRVQWYGLDDQWSWVLIPFLGFTLAGCALTAIVYGLMVPEKWNARFNPGADPQAGAGATGVSPASTACSTAQQPTEGASGPTESRLGDSGSTPAIGTVREVGL